MAADLLLSALNMALVQRKPKEVIHHSDQSVIATVWPSAIDSDAVRSAFTLRWQQSAMPTKRDSPERLLQPEVQAHRAQQLRVQGSSTHDHLHLGLKAGTTSGATTATWSYLSPINFERR